jgi:alkylation response protein AidB-like acyl-CoA dehydrogenase
MTHGSDELKGRFVRRVLTGEDHWCQLFSEPGSGSDLAGLSATAQLDGQRWVVSGQKVWNTNAHQADYGLLLVRTDWSVPKHQGLTYFVLPMKQAGVQVRPLRQMNGHASFNEVFMDEAEIPRDWVVGEIGMGWTVAATTLAHERRFASMGVSHYEGEGQAVEEALEENARHFASYVWYPQRGGRPDLAVEHARRRGVSGDPVVRQALAARAAGRPPGAEGSIGKLGLTRVAREGARVHSLIAGASALTVGEPGSFESVIAEILVSVPGQSIAGGTDEIQKNIVGERMLGLAREPATDRDVPFKDVRRNL